MTKYLKAQLKLQSLVPVIISKHRLAIIGLIKHGMGNCVAIIVPWLHILWDEAEIYSVSLKLLGKSVGGRMQKC